MMSGLNESVGQENKQYPAILPVGCNQLPFRKHFWPQFILFNLFAIYAFHLFQNDKLANSQHKV